MEDEDIDRLDAYSNTQKRFGIKFYQQFMTALSSPTDPAFVQNSIGLFDKIIF